MKLIKVKNYEELSKVAAEVVGTLVKAKPNATLGLATGSSPIGLYQNLIKMHQNKEISFQGITTYNLDEYCDLPREHPESYFSFMHRNLFHHIDIKEGNIHLPSSVGKDLQKNCDDYNNALNQANIDLQVLGIGGNGHIGFNEPNTAFSQETFVVELTEKTRIDNARFFNSLEEVPTHAITMGIHNIMQVNKILLIISGKSKQDAVKRLLSGEITETFPASILHKHQDVVVIVDEDALGALA